MDYISRVYSKSQEWHNRRRKVLGGSDARIIVSGSDADVIQLWRLKRNEIEPEDLSDNLAVLMGTITEELNVSWFARKTQLAVSRCGEFVTHQSIPYMGCTLDGFIESENAVLEAKHSNTFMAWDDIVTMYFPQLTHNMIVTGAKKAYLSALLGNADWRMEPILFDPFYAEELLAAEAKFWSCVQDGTPPRALPIEVPAGEAHRVVDFTGNNSFGNFAVQWLDTKQASVTFEEAKDALKSMIEPDVRQATGYGIVITRDRRGALRIRKA